MTWKKFIVGMVVTIAIIALVPAHDSIPIEATTADGVMIRGDYWTPIRGENAPAVILLHMYRSNREAWSKEMIIALEMAGFAIARIDLRGHGESAGDLADRVKNRDPKLFNTMDKDVQATVDWLAQRTEVDSSRIAVLGASVGCSVALDFASSNHSVKAVALMSPGPQYLGVDSVAHLEGYGHRAILMLTSREEQPRGFDQLTRAAKHAGAKVETKVYDQSGIHGTNMFGKVSGVEDLIADFLKENVN